MQRGEYTRHLIRGDGTGLQPDAASDSDLDPVVGPATEKGNRLRDQWSYLRRGQMQAIPRRTLLVELAALGAGTAAVVFGSSFLAANVGAQAAARRLGASPAESEQLRPSSPPPTPTVADARSQALPYTLAWQLAATDDFRTPTGRLFGENKGHFTSTFPDGTKGEYQYSWSYGPGEMTGRISGPQPATGRLVATYNRAPDKMLADFAVEVEGRPLKSDGRTGFGIRYQLEPNTSFTYFVTPVTRYYNFNIFPEDKTAVSGRSTAFAGSDKPDLLRLEVRGDSALLFLNGHQVDAVRHDGLDRRLGYVSVAASLSEPPSDGESAIAFTRYRLFTPAAP